MAEIVPAILTNDISDFRKKYAELFALSQHFKELHVDFIDGKFLPNKTILPGHDCRIRAPFRATAHFMTLDPKQYFALAKNEGYSTVLFHFEVFENKNEVLETRDLAQTLGLRVGLVLNPETKLHYAGKFLKEFQIIQLMGVHPGKQGGEFVPGTIDKIQELRALSKSVIISVDGGIKVGIAKQCVQAGANILVAGSAILRAEDEEAALESLQHDIKIK